VEALKEARGDEMRSGKRGWVLRVGLRRVRGTGKGVESVDKYYTFNYDKVTRLRLCPSWAHPFFSATASVHREIQL